MFSRLSRKQENFQYEKTDFHHRVRGRKVARPLKTWEKSTMARRENGGTLPKRRGRSARWR